MACPYGGFFTVSFVVGHTIPPLPRVKGLRILISLRR
jgi:hypothetical protein